ncbi:MFS transporter [Leucobacter ruminantium]|uniref:MFS transporter n=2 Tax=Leucobacter ruminantium TaxID=1289170 RepID=A0A939M2Y8_9MICO|nr:MFS transporter [Leucobacter ruminantium]
MPALFFVIGLGFGSWLSRLPAVRDQLGASAVEMSVYGLCLAAGSLLGLVFSGQIVHRFGPRRVLCVAGFTTFVALPGAAAIVLSGAIPLGLAVLFVYGIAFSIADVAMNVSGANAEAALGRPRMPLMHAGYSLGAVAATGVGALAEALSVPVPLHFAIVMLASAAVLVALLPVLPRDERTARHGTDPSPNTGAIPVIDSAAGQQPAFSPVTGSIPVIEQGSTAPPASAAHDADAPARGAGTGSGTGTAGRYSPWRDPRILLIGLIALTFGLFEGTASDWLPLALVDGRGLSNQLGTVMLSVFFAAVVAVRIIGSWLLERFGRVAVLRCSAVVAAAGVAMTILLPGTAGAVCGVVAWGIGMSLGWPIAISAAADRAETAARSVAAVSAVGYGAMLIGPLAFGFLGEHIGLLNSFWALMPFTVYTAVAATIARTRR